MAIQTTCKGCGARLSVDRDHAGRSAQCPQCGQVYVVPQSGSLPSSLDPTAQEPASNSIPPSQNAGDPHRSTGLWYLKTPEGKTYGPVDRGTLDQWATEGRVSCECMLRSDANWRPADDIYSELKPPPVERGNPFAVGPASVNPRSYREPHRGPLILGLGIAGFLVPCPILSGMAWFMGNTDLRKMQIGKMDPSGYSLTQVGRVFGMIFALLWLLSLGIFFLVFMCLIAMNA